ncbi:MAG: hypothetical protein BroJett002_37180 [Candidatus Brocadia sinica]|nr:MAG: hypothetical protein BroJett002_37180 [Candidatus Brocadia sinica]
MWPFHRKEKRSSLSNPQAWLVDMFTGGTKSATGVNVTPDRALQASAVHACVRVLSETIASLPLHVYKRLDRGKEKATDHYLYPILHDAPNPEMTSFEFRETMMGHLCLRGNAYAEKVFDRAGRIKELWPLNPDRVTVTRDKTTKQLVYTVTIPDEARKAELGSDRILHIRGLSGDGIIGYSPIKLARESIGLSLATEEYGARFFGNGSRPGGVLEHPGKLGTEARKNLKTSWEEMHKGLEQSHRIAILEEGLKWHQIGIAPEEAQFLESRQFQAVDIARIFRVPPHLVGILDRATFSNIEQQSIDFVVNTIRPWLVRHEQAYKQRLFDIDDVNHFAEFLIDGLLRGDIQSRYGAYSIGRQNGWLSADDIRELENMNPLPDGQGKTYLLPLNMVPADQTAKVGDMAKEKGLQDENKKQKQRFNNAFRHLFKDAITRIIKRERADVLRQVRKKTNAEEFEKWLDEFYKEHEEFVRRNITPVMTSFLELSGQAEAIEDGVNEYVEKHIRNSMANIRTLIANETDKEKTLIEMFDMWEGKRTTEMAIQETA